MSYFQRLHVFKTDSLELRRIKIDLIMLFKILHGTVKVNLSNGFQLHDSGYFIGGNKFKLFKNEAMLDVKKFSVANNVVSVWNCLPDEIVCCKTVNEGMNLICTKK